MKSDWKKYLLYSILIIVGGSLLFGLIRLGYSAEWTGFGEYTPTNSDAERSKTLWDWMELLIIPLVLAIGAFFLNRSERETEREIAKDRQQETALQNYFDYMTELLLERDLGNTESPEVHLAAKTRTLTVLRALDGGHKKYVLGFLRDARLIGAIVKGIDKRPVFDLSGADLSHADLRDADLRHINLQSTNLQYADLRGAYILETNFGESDMRYAKLNFADRGDFKKADLSHADMRNAVFWDMTFQEVKMHFTNLRNADFSHSAGLANCDLTGAYLKGANIPEGHLTATFLKGTTMPNGRKHK